MDNAFGPLNTPTTSTIVTCLHNTTMDVVTNLADGEHGEYSLL
jgi:hypothetical protein